MYFSLFVDRHFDVYLIIGLEIDIVLSIKSTIKKGVKVELVSKYILIHLYSIGNIKETCSSR